MPAYDRELPSGSEFRVRRPCARLAALALVIAAAGCVPDGATMFPNGAPGPGPGPSDAGPVPGGVALLTLVMSLSDDVEVCQITITVVTDAGPFTFTEPAVPMCPLDFPVVREISMTAAELGGEESMATVTAIGRDSDNAVSAQASAAVVLRVGFATDLTLSLEAF